MVNYGGLQEMPSTIRQEPVLLRLKRTREELQTRLADVIAAIEKLEAHPEVSEVLESLNKLGHY